MSHHPVPLHELSTAVKNAVKQVLREHASEQADEEALGSVEKLWVGFVAPEQFVANANVEAITARLGAGVSGQVTASIGLTGELQDAAAKTATPEVFKPVRIIGLIYDPQLAK